MERSTINPRNVQSRDCPVEPFDRANANVSQSHESKRQADVSEALTHGQTDPYESRLR